MQSEAPLTLLLSPLRAGRGELERTRLGSLFGDPDTAPPKLPLSLWRSLEKGEGQGEGSSRLHGYGLEVESQTQLDSCLQINCFGSFRQTDSWRACLNRSR